MNEHSTLEQLMTLLDADAHAFTPDTAKPHYAQQLPGREPGTNLETSAPPPAGAAAVVLDCGISRRAPYTHVLWISPAVEAILGSHASERVGQAIGRLDQVEGSEWEGNDRFHVNAPGVDWDTMVDLARGAVGALLP